MVAGVVQVGSEPRLAAAVAVHSFGLLVCLIDHDPCFLLPGPILLCWRVPLDAAAAGSYHAAAVEKRGAD